MPFTRRSAAVRIVDLRSTRRSGRRAAGGRMTSIVALSLGNSSGNVTGLVIDLLILAVNFVAVSKIITKAGYSSKWIVVPLAPVVLWVATFILLVVEVRHVVAFGTSVAQPVSLSSYRVLEVLDVLSVVATWVFFLIFAFSAWPVGQTRRGAGEFSPGRPPYVATGSAPQGQPSRGPVVAGAVGVRSAPAVAGRPATALVQEPAESAPTVIYCSWCGKERAVDAQAIHHCGSKERPAAYCMRCGTPLGDSAASCAQCGTPATQISK
jgi:hypothetical protein